MARPELTMIEEIEIHGSMRKVTAAVVCGLDADTGQDLIAFATIDGGSPVYRADNLPKTKMRKGARKRSAPKPEATGPAEAVEPGDSD